MQTRVPGDITVAIVSDIHYAGSDERARGENYEFRMINNPLLRLVGRAYRHLIWMRHPFAQTKQLDRFLAEPCPADYLVANGDYSCDSAFVGVSDTATFHSARECLEKLRMKFNGRAYFTIGDHDLGKLTLFCEKGGMRLASLRCATELLGLQPFWKFAIGRYLLIGVSSPLIALPAYQTDVLPEEWMEWQQLRETHLNQIRATFDDLQPDQRVLLFCHDPTALPFLYQEESVCRRLSQVEQTILGHLHTPLILWKSQMLSGIPPIHFFGRNVSRFTSALNKARCWRAFNVRLCPALSGIELLNDGGYYIVHIDPEVNQPARFIFHPMPR